MNLIKNLTSFGIEQYLKGSRSKKKKKAYEAKAILDDFSLTITSGLQKMFTPPR